MSSKLPESFVDEYRRLTGKNPSEDVMTHCRRELMQAVLAIIFGQEFEDAYKRGIVVNCADKVLRRMFPRIFTWSADYPEK